MRAAIALLLVACGGGARPATAPDGPDELPVGAAGDELPPPAAPREDEPAPAPASRAVAEVTGRAVCERILALRADGCAFVANYDLDLEACARDYDRSLRERGADARATTEIVGRCFLEETACDATLRCIDARLGLMLPGDDERRACADATSPAAVGYPDDQYAKRRGVGARTFADAPSSVEQPIEVCMVRGAKDWLTRTTCADGSRPFATDDHAHAARVRSVGTGGRCGAIIDLYEVPCPEATYPVYIDMYVCPMP